MPRAPARFTKSDLIRAAQAVQAAGLKIAAVRVDRDGKIEVICGEAQAPDPEPAVPRSLAEWKNRKHGQG